jgi:hypothetical protein
MKSARVVSLLVVALFTSPVLSHAGPITISFDDLAEGAAVTTQYSGVTFSNATVLTAGISLNEFEFPPNSDPNVVFDDGGAIGLLFAMPTASFSGYFTYSVPLTLYAYDASNTLLTSITSAYFSNLALSGDPGSTPNEFLQVVSAQGISRVVIEGDVLGGSFTVDDLTATSVPEPGSLMLLAAGGVALALKRRAVRP